MHRERGGGGGRRPEMRLRYRRRLYAYVSWRGAGNAKLDTNALVRPDRKSATGTPNPPCSVAEKSCGFFSLGVLLCKTP